MGLISGYLRLPVSRDRLQLLLFTKLLAPTNPKQYTGFEAPVNEIAKFPPTAIKTKTHHPYIGVCISIKLQASITGVVSP